jgi:hypothetical protein
MLDLLRKELGPKLSQGASITAEAPPRWSTYKAPKSLAVVNINNEQDVVNTVRMRASESLFVNANHRRSRSATSTTFLSSLKMEEADGQHFRRRKTSS